MGTVAARASLTAAAGERGGFGAYARGGTGTGGGLGGGGDFGGGGFRGTGFGGGGLPNAGFGTGGGFTSNPLRGLAAPSLTTASGIIGLTPTRFATAPSVAARPSLLTTTGIAGMFGGAVQAQSTTGGGYYDRPRGAAVSGSGFPRGWRA